MGGRWPLQNTERRVDDAGASDDHEAVIRFSFFGRGCRRGRLCLWGGSEPRTHNSNLARVSEPLCCRQLQQLLVLVGAVDLVMRLYPVCHVKLLRHLTVWMALMAQG